mgnify:CR=1 FL=1
MKKTSVKLSHWAVLPLLLALPASIAVSADMKSPEQVRAAYLLNMYRFVKVGNPPTAARQFCYYEKAGIPFDESVGQMLEKYVAESPTIKGQIPPVKRYQAIRDLKGCDIFFIPADEDASVDNILAALGSSSTLTVSSAKRFIYRGGMIGFIMGEGKVGMEGDMDNMDKKQVNVDAQLLEIMVTVNGRGRTNR